MVAPSLQLYEKIRNTKELIKKNKRHLIEDYRNKYPNDFISETEHDKLQQIKPWMESHNKERKLRTINKTHTHLSYSQQSLQTPYDNILILCVDFNDKPAQIPISEIYNKFFTDIPINLTNMPIRSSFKTFWLSNSYNSYNPTGEVHGWYRAPQLYSYYTDNNYSLGDYPNNIQKLVEDVLSLISTDPNIDLQQIDTNNDNHIDYLMIIHAGDDAASTGNVNDVWSHMWEISPKTIKGKIFRYYATTSEYIYHPSFNNDPRRIGVDCHEFGHLLDLPDLYDYSGNSNGVGLFSIMSHGSWLNDGYLPSNLDAWSKFKLGYTNTLTNQNGILQLTDANTSNTNYIFTKDINNTNEYFIIENRQQTSFDYFLPANGMLVWKVNELQPTNDNELCFKVALIQADNMKHLENQINYGDNGDPYPGLTNKRSLGQITTPSTIMCNNTYPSNNFYITSISDSNNTMTFYAYIYNEEICSPPLCDFSMI